MLALAAAFVLGWRVMPKVWPAVRSALVPQPTPAPSAAPEPYVPRGTAAVGDPVGANDSLIYYFYKDYCPYCREIEPLMAGLPDRITLPDGTPSDVKLVPVNKVEDTGLALITAWYDAHDVPEEKRYVPAVVIGGRYLFAGAEIIADLADALAAGEGLRTAVIDGAARVP